MTDITELAQMKGQKVEGSYYLAECTDCGKMYPSNKLNGGEPLFSGDYGECHCPHCNADDAAIGDCGDTAAIAWNYQQGRIDALVEALEKSEKTSEGRREAIDITHKRAARERDRANAAEEALEKAQETIAFQQGEIKALLSSLESRTMKLPEVERPIDGTGYANAAGAQYYKERVIKALTAQGIKVEAE